MKQSRAEHEGLMDRIKAHMELSHYGKRFMHRIQVAMRSGWACLFCGGVVQFGSPVNKWLAIPFFSLVICLNIVDSNIGAVLRNSVSVMVGMGEALTLGAIVYLILGTHISLVTTLVCIFLCSFCVAYPTTLVGHEMARKVSLALVGIIFTAAYSGVNDGSIYFLVRLMGTTSLGVVCALVAVCFPIPGLAIWEVRGSAKSTVKGASKLYGTLTDAFCMKEMSQLSSIFLYAKFLAKTAASSLDDHNNKLDDAFWELRGFNKFPDFKRMTEGLNGLKLHMMGMCMALQSGFILQHRPPTMVILLRGIMKRLVERSTQMLDLTVRLKKSKSAQNLKKKQLELAREDLHSFDQKLKEAREKSYYQNLIIEDDQNCLEGLKVTTSAQPEVQITAAGVEDLFHSMVPTYFFLFNLRRYFTEVMHMLDCKEVANPVQDVGSSRFHMPVLHQTEIADGLSEKVEVVVTPIADELVKGSTERRKIDVVFPSTDESDSESKADTQPITPSRIIPKSMILICAVCRRLSLEREQKASNSTLWKWLWEQVRKRFKRHQVVRALKISLAMSLAALAGCLYNRMYSFWAEITVAFIIQNQQGGSFRMANLRLQGTVIGSIYAYLLVNILSKHPKLLLLSLVPWVVMLNYLKFSKLFGASGVIAGLTAAIVMLGGDGLPIQQLAVIRITENFIGVLALILVEAIVWPQRAAALSRKELVSCFIDLRDCVKTVVEAYTGHHCHLHRKLVVQEIRELEGHVRKRIAQQMLLQAEAQMEPELWSHPFPAEIYSKLLHIQSRMHDLLLLMLSSLHAAIEDCLTEQIHKLVGPLQTSLAALEDEVLSSLHLLQKLLQMGTSTVDGLSKNSSCEKKRPKIRTLITNVHGKSFSDLRKMMGEVHPLLLLESQERDIDGTPLSLKRTMDAFEASYEHVVGGFIADKKANPDAQILSNAAMLSFSALTFSLQSLLGETVQLQKAVHELLHFENPWSVLEFWESIPNADEECRFCVDADGHSGDESVDINSKASDR
ncbi:hypothetical protein R1flu_000153 [Riccia fluitans]|uniref:Fusaric acid resistance protein n=1 Tax=Riccia fluitans TaxID=41844 RepID=A0ABD1XZL8_9MARC